MIFRFTLLQIGADGRTCTRKTTASKAERCAILYKVTSAKSGTLDQICTGYLLDENQADRYSPSSAYSRTVTLRFTRFRKSGSVYQRE